MMPTIIVVLQRTDESLSSSEVAGWSEVTGSWCPWQTLCKGRVWEDTTLFSWMISQRVNAYKSHEQCLFAQIVHFQIREQDDNVSFYHPHCSKAFTS